MLSHDLYSPVEGILNLGRLGADLDGVRSMGRVLKQSIVWVEQLSGELEEKLTLWTTVVESRQVAEFKSHIKHQGSRFKNRRSDYRQIWVEGDQGASDFSPLLFHPHIVIPGLCKYQPQLY